MKNKIVSIFIIFSIIFLLNGCSVYHLWNPVFQDAEMSKYVSFNKNDVAIKISRFAFINTWRGPYVIVKIKNFSNDTLFINPDNFKVLAKKDTLSYRNKSEVPSILLPGKKTTINISYNYYLKEKKTVDTIEGHRRVIKELTSVVFIIGDMRLGDNVIEMPSIEYRYPIKIINHNGIYEFRNKKFY